MEQSTLFKDLIINQARQEEFLKSPTIAKALANCSIEEADWRYVAGRLLIQQLYKENTFYQNTLDKLYQQDLFRYYSIEDLQQAKKWIDPSRDFLFDYAGAWLLKNRYLQPSELPQEAFLIVSLILAKPETPANRLRVAKEFYDAISTLKLSLATPLLANLRQKCASVSSCFIVQLEDDLDSIMKTLTDAAFISKKGGGVGVNISAIRATGATINGKENASNGVLPWVKLFNDIALAVDQGGSRAGAITVSLDAWHYDILDFLDCQTETGDQRNKSYDIFPQIVVPDLLMSKIDNNEDWYLFDPKEIFDVTGYRIWRLWGNRFEEVYNRCVTQKEKFKRVKVIGAKDLYKKIMHNQIETGLPYVVFKDTINRANPNPYVGIIPAANLCVESYSAVVPHKYNHVCNLTSLNLANIDFEDLEYYSDLAVRLLDNSIDVNYAPTEATALHNNTLRVIGVGTMGLADMLAKYQKTYTSTSFISSIYETISWATINASIDLAREREPFAEYPISTWSENLINNRDFSWYKVHAQNSEKWKQLFQKLKANGIRNSQITAIAPNTSSSLVQGCTASYLPPHQKYFINKGIGAAPITPPFINDYYWYYQENIHVHPQTIVDVTALIQKWIDTGISMELLFNFNENAYSETSQITPKDMFEVQMSAWKQGCKAIYYIRQVVKDSYLTEISEIKECSACAS